MRYNREEREPYRTTQQNARLHKLLSNCRIKEDVKKSLVLQFTGGRTDRSSLMYMSECKALINHLAKDDPGDKMRKKILSACYELGWTNYQGKVDMDRLNSFLRLRGAVKRPLNYLSVKDLTQVVSQFDLMLQKHYEQIRENKV